MPYPVKCQIGKPGSAARALWLPGRQLESAREDGSRGMDISRRASGGHRIRLTVFPPAFLGVSIKSHRKLQIVSPKIASHQNGAFLAYSDRVVCITENCKCITENCNSLTENCKEVSPIIARKYHRKLQAPIFHLLTHLTKNVGNTGRCSHVSEGILCRVCRLPAMSSYARFLSIKESRSFLSY